MWVNIRSQRLPKQNLLLTLRSEAVCHLSAYLGRNGQEELLLEDVVLIEVASENVFLTILYKRMEERR